MHGDLKRFVGDLENRSALFSAGEQAWLARNLDRQLLRAHAMILDGRHSTAIEAMPGDPQTEADIEREAVAYTKWPTDNEWLTIAELYRSYRPPPSPDDPDPEVAARRSAASFAVANMQVGGRRPSDAFLLLQERWIVGEISTEQMIEAVQRVWGNVPQVPDAPPDLGNEMPE